MTETAPVPAAANDPRVPADVLLAEVTRGPHVESVHVGAVALSFADGRTWTVGDAEAPVWMRSAVKPFQALPLLERGIADRLGLGAAELALISASHDGTAAHVEVVERILARAGLGPDLLQCGAHAPFDKASSVAIARSGGKPQRIHNNCSGKHAGFLLLAQDLGAPVDAYLEPDSPGQVLVRRAVAEMTGLAAEDVAVAVDGCGAPTLYVPLLGLARGFCRLVNPAGLPAVRVGSCGRLLAAITQEPVLLSGENRICAALIRSAPGRVYPKNGAEGIYAVGVRSGSLPGGGCGVAIKVRDGAERAYWPVAVEILRRLGIWGSGGSVPPTLARFAAVPVPNTQGREVGVVRCSLELGALEPGALEGASGW